MQPTSDLGRRAANARWTGGVIVLIVGSVACSDSTKTNAPADAANVPRESGSSVQATPGCNVTCTATDMCPGMTDSVGDFQPGFCDIPPGATSGLCRVPCNLDLDCPVPFAGCDLLKDGGTSACRCADAGG